MSPGEWTAADAPEPGGKVHGEIGDPEGGKQPGPGRKLPPESDPDLINPDSTPGSGMLPPIGDEGTSNIQPSG